MLLFGGVSPLKFELYGRAANLRLAENFRTDWVFSVGLGFILTITCKLGLMGFWIALVVDDVVRAIFTSLRWKSNRWATKS